VFIVIGPEDNQWLNHIRLGIAPRFDYRLVADRCHGEIREFYPSSAMLSGHKLLRSSRSLAANTWLACQTIRSIPWGSVIYSTGETWGLPIALASNVMGRRHIHIAYVHRIYSATWLRLIRYLRPILHVDGWICITEFQAGLLRRTLGRKGAPVAVVSQGVDTAFFDPDRAYSHRAQPYILSVGAEMRNYPLLFEAVRDLDTRVIVKASSSWMTKTRQQLTSIPGNTELLTDHLSHPELRDLYAGASFVVMPLYDTPQAAGITGILEALAMGKCVIASRSRGLPDALIDGSTGIVVDPDVDKLAQGIRDLLSQADQTASLGENGYRLIRKAYSLEAYAEGVMNFINQIAAKAACRQSG
jgi:glycosyltransferase involved in cell wall biosynthesis